jgi:hypothetical protein
MDFFYNSAVPQRRVNGLNRDIPAFVKFPDGKVDGVLLR